MNKSILSLMCLTLATMVNAADNTVTDADLADAYKAVSYAKRISLHDPSIFIDTISNPAVPAYYIYGSHLGKAQGYLKTDYRAWNSFGADESETGTANSIFADKNGKLINWIQAYTSPAVTKIKNYQGEEVDFKFNPRGWQYTGGTVNGNQWAPDVVYNDTMKKWCMYMSLNGDHWCSSIVCFTSDTPKGPWVLQGPVVFSGFCGTYKHVAYQAADDWMHTDLSIATGCTKLPTRYNVAGSWGSYWPNAIDPCVFYDEDKNLWMSYGSWSGGIFLIRLDKETGLRDYTYTYKYKVNNTESIATDPAASSNCTSDPYFGIKIAGGYYVSGEASYIQKIGNYYYLFVTYGGLMSAGGYQMRVFRAASPEGPFKDCNNINAVYGAYRMNYGKDATRDEGVKLFGNYQWDTMPTAEIAQGHNSALIDQNGRALLVNHTRFNDGTEGHSVRVHQLYVNQDGWLVASPFEFTNSTGTPLSEIATKQPFMIEDVVGDYQLMVHPYRQDTGNKDYETPVNIHLSADNTVTGSYTGTWNLVEGTSYINLTLKGSKTGNASVTFKGVLAKQIIDYTDISSIVFSAVSSSSGRSTSSGGTLQTKGLCIWGSKADAKGAIKYTLDKLEEPFNDGSTINESVAMPTNAKLGATITWTSSDETILTSKGVVKGKGDVTMTLNVSKDDCEYVRTYNITVDKDAESTTKTYYPVSASKNITNNYNTNFTDDYTLKAGEEINFKFYNYSDATANYHNWVLCGANSDTHSNVYFMLRADNWENIAGTTANADNNFDWNTFTTDMNGSQVDMTVGLTSEGIFTMKSTITTKAGKTYTYDWNKTLSLKPSQITVYFTGEKSYIDGSSLKPTGIEYIKGVNEANCMDGKMYNLSGQQVDDSYCGIVIINGKKYRK